VARMEERKCSYWVFVGIPEGKKLLGESNRRWEDTIKIDLQEIGWIGVRGLNFCGSG
jgi:hypothetical protein